MQEKKSRGIKRLEIGMLLLLLLLLRMEDVQKYEQRKYAICRAENDEMENRRIFVVEARHQRKGLMR
jgi:hypothetical protein